MLFCWGIAHYSYHYKEVQVLPPPPAEKQNSRVIFWLDIGTDWNHSNSSHFRIKCTVQYQYTQSRYLLLKKYTPNIFIEDIFISVCFYKKSQRRKGFSDHLR